MMTDAASNTAGAESAVTPAPSTSGGEMTVEQARARRDEMIRTASEKHLTGDADTRREMHRLNEIIAGGDNSSRLEAALAGVRAADGIETTDDENFLTQSQMASEVRHLQKSYSDETIRDIINGTPVTAEKRREAAIAKERILRDREFMRGYREGHSEKVELVRNIAAVLSAPVEG